MAVLVLGLLAVGSVATCSASRPGELPLDRLRLPPGFTVTLFSGAVPGATPA